MKTWIAARLLVGAAQAVAAGFEHTHVWSAAPTFANATDRAVAGVYNAREADWRNGAVVYQVLVDRLAPVSGST